MRLFSHYSAGFDQRAIDEMFHPDGAVREPYLGIADAIGSIAPANLRARLDALGRAFIDQGVTFSLSGKERPFPSTPSPDHFRR